MSPQIIEIGTRAIAVITIVAYAILVVIKKGSQEFCPYLMILVALIAGFVIFSQSHVGHARAENFHERRDGHE